MTSACDGYTEDSAERDEDTETDGLGPEYLFGVLCVAREVGHVECEGGFGADGGGHALEEDDGDGGAVFDICAFAKGCAKTFGGDEGPDNYRKLA